VVTDNAARRRADSGDQVRTVGARTLSSRLTHAIGAALLLLGTAQSALAGSQTQEPLADAVRTALSAAVSSDDLHRSAVDRTELVALRNAWVQRIQPLLEQRLRRVAVNQWRQEWSNPALQRELLETIWYEATRARLEPELVLGLIEVESDFRKFAVSSAGALGLMQVMPFWMRELAQDDPRRLFHLRTNLRFGCVILRHYLDREAGDLFMALGRYNGSRGQAPYPNAVLAARAGWRS
jgi:soluble lytic murein transglycosylase-like protein